MVEMGQIYCGDCLDVMRDIEDNSIDLVLTDPPYNASNSKISVPNRMYKSINEEWDKNFDICFMDEVVRILKDDGSLLVFCSYHLLCDYLSFDLLILRQLLHWIKRNPMPAMMNYYGFAVEYIVWFTKSNKYKFYKEYRISYDNVFYTNVNGFKETNHPTEKPLSIISGLIKAHSDEYDIVLDPFLGSGTTAVACVKLNRHYIGIELDPTYIEIAKRRVEDAKLVKYSQPELFAV